MCSAHFVPEDYRGTVRKLLKPYAVPNVLDSLPEKLRPVLWTSLRREISPKRNQKGVIVTLSFDEVSEHLDQANERIIGLVHYNRKLRDNVKDLTKEKVRNRSKLFLPIVNVLSSNKTELTE